VSQRLRERPQLVEFLLQRRRILVQQVLEAGAVELPDGEFEGAG
jgi:hypothetical protein